MEWGAADDTPHVFWLNGVAGTGKSTITRTVAS
jgi:adenylylsulfate kinase-like enzyme